MFHTSLNDELFVLPLNLLTRKQNAKMRGKNQINTCHEPNNLGFFTNGCNLNFTKAYTIFYDTLKTNVKCFH